MHDRPLRARTAPKEQVQSVRRMKGSMPILFLSTPGDPRRATADDNFPDSSFSIPFENETEGLDCPETTSLFATKDMIAVVRSTKTALDGYRFAGVVKVIIPKMDLD